MIRGILKDGAIGSILMEVSLKRILKRAGGVLEGVIQTLDTPIQIWDQTGELLVGSPAECSTVSYPITAGSHMIGRVEGGKGAIAVANLLSYLCDRELEAKTLAGDALDKYREINLLYNLAEKLNASLDPAVVAQTILGEARRLIPATGSALVLLDPVTRLWQAHPVFTEGDEILPEVISQPDQGILGAVVCSGKGEIVNQPMQDPRYQPGVAPVASLICVPLKTENGVIGVLTLSHQDPIEYTAQHLKLLTTVASQAAQSIENARLYQQQRLESQEREALLQRQLQELQLAVDEAKRSHQVSEITETEYFQQLQQRASQLRRRRSETSA